jgi:hypothetical protein
MVVNFVWMFSLDIKEDGPYSSSRVLAAKKEKERRFRVYVFPTCLPQMLFHLLVERRNHTIHVQEACCM